MDKMLWRRGQKIYVFVHAQGIKLSTQVGAVKNGNVVVECPLSSMLKQWRHTFLIKKVQYVHKSLPTYSVFMWCNFSFMGRLCWIMVESERWDTFQFIMTKWWNYIAFCEMNLVVTVLDLHNNPFSSFLSKTPDILKEDIKVLSIIDN